MKYTKSIPILSETILTTKNSGVIDVSDLDAIKIKIVAAAVGGTNPTLDFTIKDSEDGTTFDSHTAVTQITGNGTTIVRISKFTKFLRLDGVIGGTNTPTFGIVATAIGIRRPL